MTGKKIDGIPLPPVSEETWYEVFERAVLRIEKMSYEEFANNTTAKDYKLLVEIERHVAERMTEDFIGTGEW